MHAMAHTQTHTLVTDMFSSSSTLKKKIRSWECSLVVKHLSSVSFLAMQKKTNTFLAWWCPLRVYKIPFLCNTEAGERMTTPYAFLNFCNKWQQKVAVGRTSAPQSWCGDISLGILGKWRLKDHEWRQCILKKKNFNVANLLLSKYCGKTEENLLALAKWLIKMVDELLCDTHTPAHPRKEIHDRPK